MCPRWRTDRIPPIRRPERFLPNPQSQAARWLLGHERLLLAQRPHWMCLVPPCVALAVSVVLLAAAALALHDAGRDPPLGLIIVAVAVPAAAVVGIVLRWVFECLAVTDLRLLSIRGLLYQEVTSVRLTKVTSADLSVNPLGSRLGYASVVVRHPGHHTARRFRHVTDPVTVCSILSTGILPPEAATDPPPP